MATPLQLAAETRAWKALRSYASATEAGERDKAYQEFKTTLNYVTPDAKDDLDQALVEISAADAKGALAAYAAAAARMKAFSGDFDLGAEIARANTKDLFFPAAASYLSGAAHLLEQIKKAAETVKDEITSLKGGFEKKDLAGLIEDANSVVASAELIKDTLEDLKESLPDKVEEEE